MEKILLSGNEAVALAAFHAGTAYATGYPGTPSTEIIEEFHRLGGTSAWAPNEKVALEVGIGVAFAHARSLVTMKHVGLNVAADPFFTAAYTGVDGGLVVISADDPGMASSQNEQDNRYYARAAGIPMFEPADSQDAYNFTREAFSLSEKWKIPFLLRMTTRVCHSTSVVHPEMEPDSGKTTPCYIRDIPGKVMIPANARPARLRHLKKLDGLAGYSENCPLHQREDFGRRMGIITSGVAYLHCREAAPDASILKIAMTYPLPMEMIAEFAGSVEQCWIIEEGDPWLRDAIAAAGISVKGKPAAYRFGELNVARVREILLDTPPAPQRKTGVPGKAPELCPGCPHRTVYGILEKVGCIAAGDIGCYSLGALPPFNAMDTLVCMGAAIGVGLGMRHVLPETEARNVVSVIGDSTFFHSGLTGLLEAVYNRPKTGHVVIVLDNRTTAMTGLQEHPGTGLTLDGTPVPAIEIERIAAAMGDVEVSVMDPVADPDGFETVLRHSLETDRISVLIARRPCLLAAARQRKNQAEGENP